MKIKKNNAVFLMFKFTQSCRERILVSTLDISCEVSRLSDEGVLKNPVITVGETGLLPSPLACISCVQVITCVKYACPVH